MSYTKTTWANGDVINAQKLNNLENGVYANDTNIGDLSDLNTTEKNTLVAAINEAAQSGGGGGGSVSPYTSNPAALGTASPGSSANYSRGDHVHPMPSASDVGALPSSTVIPSTAADVGAIPAPSSPSTGAFLVWNGTAWVAQTLSTWQGGSY